MTRHRLCLASLAPFTLAAPLTAQHWFETVQLHTDPDAAGAVAVLDADQDGVPDLLRGTTTSARIARGNGDGSFAIGPLLAPIAGPKVQQFSDQQPGVVADVDGDGRPDYVYARDGLLIGAGNPYTIDTLFGTGTTTLAPPVSFSLGAYPATYGAWGLCTADVDGDGRPEIGVVESAPGTGYVSIARWLDWNGASYVSGQPLTLTGLTQSDPPGDVDGLSSVAALDWNGDGSLELVATEWLNPNLVWLTSHGLAPSFGGKFALPFPLNSLRALDADGDGQTDLLGRSLNQQDIRIALVHGGPGAWTTEATPPLGMPLQSIWHRQIWSCDWDADGDLDAVLHTSAASGNEAALFLANDGAGVYAVASTRITDSSYGYVGGAGFGQGGGPADFDGDGHVDLALSRAVLYGDGAFPTEASGPYATFPQAFVALDMESDGDLDAVTTDGRRGVSDGVSIGPVGAIKYPPLGSFMIAETAGIGDFDGDGRVDQVANLYQQILFGPKTYQSTHLYLDIGKSTFVDIGVCAASEIAMGPDFGGYPQRGIDFDGDGDLDLLTPTGLWIKTGLYTFGTYVPLFAPDASAVISDVCDVDGDGDLDFVRSTGSGSGGVVTNTLHRDQGGYAFTNEPLLAAVDLDEVPRFLDLDGDGDRDLVTGHDLHSGAALYLHENVGGLLVLAATLPGTQGQIDCYGVDDVDGDGLADLLCAPREAAYDFGLLSVYRRSGPFAYEAPREYLTRHVRAFVDVDSDGDVDAVGNRLVRGHREHGPGSGAIRQYGTGTAGSIGVVPVLGASGPLQTGYTNGELRVVNALGGASGLLVVGFQQSALPNIPFAGATLYASPILFSWPIQLGGPPGLPALGSFTLPIAQFAGLAGGLTFYHQVGIVDPGTASGLALTNGLAITYGY